MAVIVAPIPTGIAANRAEDLAAQAATQTALSGAGSFFHVEVDNSANTHAVSLRLYDSTTAQAGVTDPNDSYRVAAGAVGIFPMPPDGIAYTTGIMYSCSQEAGTAGATNPASSVPVTIQFT